MTGEKTSAVGQTLTGTTWGSPVQGRYSGYKNGRFAWFKQAKFGIFIHWGVYSLLEGEWKGQEYRGIAEWIMRKLEIPVEESVASAVLLDGGDSLTFCRDQNGYLVIDLPEQLPGEAVSVIVLNRQTEEERARLLLPNQPNTLCSGDFETDQGVNLESVRWMHERFGNWHHRDVLHFDRAGARACCAVRAPFDGEYRVLMEYDFGPADDVGQRHTLEGRGTVPTADSEVWKGVFAVDENEYEIMLSHVECGYFELRTACSCAIEIPEGRHHMSLRAINGVDIEISSLQIIPI